MGTFDARPTAPKLVARAAVPLPLLLFFLAAQPAAALEPLAPAETIGTGTAVAIIPAQSRQQYDDGPRRRNSNSGRRRNQEDNGQPDRRRRGDDEGERESGPRMRQLDEVTRGAFLRRSVNREAQIARGLMQTGLSAAFPAGLSCREVDERWAIDYSGRAGRQAGSVHGGIDMPAPFGTPIIAAADGTVIAKFRGERGKRGFEIILQHAPQQTGLPVWTYTQYAHLSEFPGQRLGQTVRMGETVGLTSNTGQGSNKRRPAIHFAVFYSTVPRHVITRHTLIPVDGYWMDPHAFYRGRLPVDSHSMKALPPDQKRVTIPVMLDDRTTIPAGTKVIWPYSCRRG